MKETIEKPEQRNYRKNAIKPNNSRQIKEIIQTNNPRKH